MSEYTNYYTASDTYVFIESPASTSQPIQLDTLSTIGWSESLTSAPTYGLGEQRFGFINQGNLIANGIIELNFTDALYMRAVLDEAVKGKADLFANLTAEEAFGTGDLNLVQQYAAQKKIERNALVSNGINTYPEGFNIRVVFNNGNLYHKDINKDVLLIGCKIIGSQMTSSITVPGQITQQFRFLARELVI